MPGGSSIDAAPSSDRAADGQRAHDGRRLRQHLRAAAAAAHPEARVSRLAAAGTLTMLFQMAASVAQVGFGHLADRWRPRLLVMAGPVVSVLGPQPDRHRAVDSGWLAAIADRRRPRRARRFIRRRPRSRTGSAAAVPGWRCRCTSPAARSASRSARCFRAGRAALRPRMDAAAGYSRVWLVIAVLPRAGAADSRCIRTIAAGFRALRPVRAAARPPLPDRRACER